MNKPQSKILVIDDDGMSRSMLKMMLAKAGYQAVSASSGEEGIALHERIGPDLVLLDARMPGMDGFSCCQQLRKLPGGEHIPILMVTGLDDQASINSAFTAGATDYITKPVQMTVLAGRIGHLIQSAHATQNLQKSEKKYRSLICSLQEVIFQLDVEGKLIFVNPAWEKLTGHCPKHSIGKPFESFLHPVEQQRHQLQLKKALDHPQHYYRYRSRCLTEDSRIRWIEIQLHAAQHKDGHTLELSGRLSDTTDRTIREHYRSLEYTITRVLSDTDNCKTVVRRVMQAICSTLGFQLGEFWQLDTKSQELHCLVRWHLKTAELQQFSTASHGLMFPIDRGIPGKTWQTEKVVWIKELSQEPQFSRQHEASQSQLRSLVSCPIGQNKEKIGILLLFSQTASPPDTDLMRMLTILGRQLSQYLKRQQAEKKLRCQNQRLQLELQRAAEYVEDLLPGPYGTTSARDACQKSIRIQTQYQPSNALGGDAFDHTWLDDNHLMFHLLDVAGHGIKSALLSVSILNVLRKRALRGADLYQPETVLAALNDVFQASDSGDDYFTLWYGVYNIKQRILTFASAGHPPAVLLTNAGEGYRATYLDSPGIPIGLMPDSDFDVRQQKIASGSSLYLFSDGAYEVPIAEDHTILGLDGWSSLLLQHKHANLPTLQPLLEKICLLNKEERLEDDFSLLEISFL